MSRIFLITIDDSLIHYFVVNGIVIKKFKFMYYRYAMDVNLERAEDVLTHKRLLDLARNPANRPAFEVRLVQVRSCYVVSDIGKSL